MKASAIFQKVSSFLSFQVLAQAESKFSGQLKVINSFGDVYISTGVLTQTGGIVRNLWLPTVKKISKYYRHKSSDILILGLAGGTLARLINKYLPNTQITGVEIDPVMITLGRKYLGLGQIENLKIINKDANVYITNTHHIYDIVFVDLYLYDQIPKFVYTKIFLKQLGKLGKQIIINHLFFDNIKKYNAEKLIKTLETLKYEIHLQRILTNVLIIATPKIPPEIPSLLPQNVF